MIKRVQGNLLKADTEALVNTVNTVGVMGKGIALQFKKAFPETFKYYRKACKEDRLTLGRVLVHDMGALVGPRYIIHFPTKKHWRSRSRIADIEAGLASLVDEVKRRGIRSVAIPPLGCGYGGLRWEEVSPRIEAACASLPEVHVQLFEPRGAPKPEAMPNATTRPAMTPGRAAVLKIMDRYLVPLWGYRLSLLETQKLAYLAQESGQPLRLTFVKHHYGPYADTLRHVLNRIEGHFVTGFGAGESKPDTPLSLLPGAVEEATSFLEREGDQQTAARIDRVARLIEGFETPHGMELLTTVHWSATRDVEPRADLDTVTRAVHAWSPRKKKLFPAEQIESAWKQLVEQGWLEAPTDPAA